MADVFVGIPTHERPGYLRETLASVREQAGVAARVLVSDDASGPDAARDVAEHVRSLADPRVDYVHHAESRWEYGQGRYLFSRCDEEFFVILHDDDLLHPDYLRTALDTLARHPEFVCFVANPYVFDAEGRRDEERTRRYLLEHGRDRRREGPVDMLEPLMRWGFIPISGTVFRSSALLASGYVSPEIHGNYPFEFDLIVRLGARGGQAWFCEHELLGFRYHTASLRAGLWFDPGIVANTIAVLRQYRFEGGTERIRRKLLGSKLRRQAALRMAADDGAGCRQSLRAALAVNPASWRSLVFALGAHGIPGLFGGRVRRWVADNSVGSRAMIGDPSIPP